MPDSVYIDPNTIGKILVQNLQLNYIIDKGRF